MSEYGAVAITQFGDVEQLHPLSLPLPTPANNQALVRINYAAINPIDCKTRAGLGWAAQQNADQLPWVPGYDMSGTVVSCVDNINLPEGTKVTGMVGFPLQGGCYGQYVLADINELVALNEKTDLLQAAGLPLAGLTAWQALFDHGQLQSGESILISAAAGGVGHIAVQLASQAGAKVIAVASKANHDFLLALGADYVIDYSDSETLKDELSRLSQVDMLLDLVGGDAGVSLLPYLREAGRVVTVPSLSKEQVCQAASSMGLSATGMLVAPNQAQLQKLVELLELAEVEPNKLTVEVARCFPVSQVGAAHRLSEQGHVRGKLLLDLTSFR